ncbi:MAG: hypothetical protein IPJ61_21295 [Tessaracoccus sp.]|uniref:hypothetical protein n=1 Tax=Tessaracoccus sp. TaxID=1971211 RepID=UPI001ECF72B1|nr:hypothetical protein [Tessaracoccus sp.]MBK7823525.1 hypothetical protein [Tessaracoccus sp.]
MPVFDAPRPKVAAEFEAAMDDLMKRPPSPERSQLTCLFIKKKREVFRLPASIQRPERVPEEEWRQAQIEYGETEIDIAEMCEDMDGKPEGGEDEEVLRLLRQRYEKLVSLTRDP